MKFLLSVTYNVRGVVYARHGQKLHKYSIIKTTLANYHSNRLYTIYRDKHELNYGMHCAIAAPIGQDLFLFCSCSIQICIHCKSSAVPRCDDECRSLLFLDYLQRSCLGWQVIEWTNMTVPDILVKDLYRLAWRRVSAYCALRSVNDYNNDD